jgi:release factor glutamine methyltransferase
MEDSLGLESHQLVSCADLEVSDEVRARAGRVIARRLAREPLQYILGTQEFCGLEFSVSTDVLIPRPETELLVQEVVRRGGLKKGSTVVEVGTGSGCIAVTLATVLQHARMIAIDRSPQALGVAKGNAVKHAVDRRIDWLEGDLLNPLAGRGLDGGVDVIVSNPPYIAEADWNSLQPEVRLFEPREALVAGATGTEMHERLLREAKPFLAPAGLLLMEIGQGQVRLIRQLAEEIGGYAPLQVIMDMTGVERVVILQRIG